MNLAQNLGVMGLVSRVATDPMSMCGYPTRTRHLFPAWRREQVINPRSPSPGSPRAPADRLDQRRAVPTWQPCTSRLLPVASGLRRRDRDDACTRSSTHCPEGNVAGTAPHRTERRARSTPTCFHGITELPSRASDGLTPPHAARVDIVVILSWTASVRACVRLRCASAPARRGDG
jgi:hypothetical protein